MTLAEIGKNADLVRLLNHGYLPTHNESDRPERLLASWQRSSDCTGASRARAERPTRSASTRARFGAACASTGSGGREAGRWRRRPSVAVLYEPAH